MVKWTHEIRDPIHVFIRVTNDEREVINSEFFQRLRYIHQLALTYLIYPGATHRRFEHSLGVMELAGRVFDVVTADENVTKEVKELLPEIADKVKLTYWRRLLRIAALCHDLGHLPFSHAAEKELLPKGWNHERITANIILHNSMKKIWEQIRLQPNDIIKLAVGLKETKKLKLDLTAWEATLSEIICSDAFGVDRMDYLLRDSLHTGVAYGKFDHFRLIDTLRVLPASPSGNDDQEKTDKTALGVEEGGLQSAEALLLARYFMYSQMYFHRVRRIYDIHLKDFLKKWKAKFPTDPSKYLHITDNEVMAALWESAYDKRKPGHEAAKCIIFRNHFKVLYERNPNDVKINPEAGKYIFESAKKEFGKENLRHDFYAQKGNTSDFPVQLRNGTIVSSLSLSDTLNRIPVVSIDYVFVERNHLHSAQKWLKKNQQAVILPKKDREDAKITKSGYYRQPCKKNAKTQQLVRRNTSTKSNLSTSRVKKRINRF